MRVLLVLPGKGLGGIEQVCVDYAKLLSARGHDVTMCLHPRSKTRGLVRDQGVDGVKMVLSRVVAGKYVRYNPLNWVRGLSIIAGNKIDVVVVLNRKMLPLFKGLARGQHPVVAYCASYLFDQFLIADAVICVTSGMADRLRQTQIERGVPDRPVYCVPNPLSIPVSQSRPVTRDPSSLPVTIGALGRMHRIKGFHVLLKAASLLKEQDVPFRMVMGGDGPELPALQQLSEELGLMNHVDFPGWITNRGEFFDRTDIVCLPSFSETFGLVATEAMARGCPVIVSDTEGPLSIVDDEVNGLVVEKGAIDAWASAMRRLIEDSQLAVRLAMAGQASVVQRFGDKAVGERLETVLKTVIGNYRKSRC